MGVKGKGQGSYAHGQGSHAYGQGSHADGQGSHAVSRARVDSQRDIVGCIVAPSAAVLQ